MRLCVRLGVLTVLLVGIAMALVYIRTDTARAGNRLNRLFRDKRELERSCRRLELEVASLKNPDRLRQETAAWQAAGLDRDVVAPP